MSLSQRPDGVRITIPKLSAPRPVMTPFRPVAVPVKTEAMPPALVTTELEPPAPAPAPMEPASPAPEVGQAFDILGEVSGLLPRLAAKCVDLEATIAMHQATLRDDLAANAEVVLGWQHLTQDLKHQVQNLTDATDDCRRRAEDAEAESERLTLAVDQSNLATSKAAALNTRFEQTILAAFGAGSAGRTVLEGIDKIAASRAA